MRSNGNIYYFPMTQPKGRIHAIERHVRTDGKKRRCREEFGVDGGKCGVSVNLLDNI
jgi:hypothetical protein